MNTLTITEHGFDSNGNRIVELGDIIYVMDKSSKTMRKVDPDKLKRERELTSLSNNFDSVDYSYTAIDKTTNKKKTVRTMTKKAVLPLSNNKAIAAIEYLDENNTPKKALTQWYISKRYAKWCLNGASGSINGLDDKDLDTVLKVQQDIGWIILS